MLLYSFTFKPKTGMEITKTEVNFNYNCELWSFPCALSTGSARLGEEIGTQMVENATLNIYSIGTNEDSNAGKRKFYHFSGHNLSKSLGHRRHV